MESTSISSRAKLSFPVEQRIEELRTWSNMEIYKEVAIWKHRNAIYFLNKQTSLRNWRESELKDDMVLTIMEAKGSMKSSLQDLIDNF